MGTGWQAEAEAASLDMLHLREICPPPLIQQGKAKGSPAFSPALRGGNDSQPGLLGLDSDVLHSPIPRAAQHLPLAFPSHWLTYA